MFARARFFRLQRIARAHTHTHSHADLTKLLAPNPQAPRGSNYISAAAADFGKRPVIINADQDQDGAGGGGAAGEMGGSAMRWMPGQLTRLAELQQRQRDEEDEEESGTVSRTRMLGSDAALLIVCANRYVVAVNYLPRAYRLSYNTADGSLLYDR